MNTSRELIEWVEDGLELVKEGLIEWVDEGLEWVEGLIELVEDGLEWVEGLMEWVDEGLMELTEKDFDREIQSLWFSLVSWRNT